MSLSLFAFLFSEVVMYCQKRASSVGDIEERLEEMGMHQGVRLLELLAHRERGLRRETRVLGMLSFVHTHVWKALFGRAADSLEKGTQAEDEYMIADHDLLVNRFISVPKDMGSLNWLMFDFFPTAFATMLRDNEMKVWDDFVVPHVVDVEEG